MLRNLLAAAVALPLIATSASAQTFLLPTDSDDARVVPASAEARHSNLGGGFIEFLFSGESRPAPAIAPDPQLAPQGERQAYAVPNDPSLNARQYGPMDPQFLRQEVAYNGDEAPGTVVIDTPNHFLYLVEPGGRAMRYGIGVGRPGFTWSGTHRISGKKEWPDWVPPKEMLGRQPGLPHFMAGGPNNPLGARAMYLGSTLYRIHGSNEPWTIGHNVSSGCIRPRNEDVIDLYERVKVGTKVVVL